MSKLYIFGIGGTGSRVLKSLTMLLASGVKIDADKIVPIIIDPDHAAADLTRTVDMLRTYESIRKQLTFDSSSQNRFFRTEFDLSVVPDVVMPLDNTQDVKFDKYIEFSQLDKANKAFASMLFSQHNLNANMDVGFKGNPNIGSVVLNQYQHSKIFQDIIASFKQGDRIFVISSIFGGTGASGFPLLVKNLRAVSNELSGNGNVKDAPIGAITVLPYFGVKPENASKSEIDSSTFIAKAKAALTYYDKNVTEPNVLYYVADRVSNQYENVDGGTRQQNDAHIVEMISALSIIDFMSIPSEELVTRNGIPETCMYKEYGIKKDSESVIFENLSEQTKRLVQTRLTQYVLFCKFMKEQLNDSIKSQQWAKDLQYDDNFLAGSFYGSLEKFRNASFAWFKELADNKRGFAPYEIEENKGELFSFVKGVKPARVMSLNSNYALFDDRLNSIAHNLKAKNDKTKNHTFVELFFQATKKLVEEKLRMF
ncbi:MAG: hypothetical protein ACI392_08840 [Paludibacteraceae bacterium]